MDMNARKLHRMMKSAGKKAERFWERLMGR